MFQRVARQSAQEALAAILENFTENNVNMPEREDGMSKYRILVQTTASNDETPSYRWIQANNRNELNDRIVQAYIDSGRIWEFLNNVKEQPNTNSISFAEYVDKWLTVYKANKLKPSTIATYKKHLHAHVLPAFGQRAISSITTEDIQLFLNERKHLTKKTLSSMRHFMGEIFKDAVEDGLIEKDPTASRRIAIPSDKSCTR
jgi:hypothetical protein